MFCDTRHHMLVSMSETDWSDVGVSDLPTGTVTLLLADVEGSTRLWETQPNEMTAAVTRLDQVLLDVVAARDGARPVEQGEGDSFVIAFARASDAVACALDLQRAPLAPIRLRIGIHTGEVRLRDEGNYIGPTIIAPLDCGTWPTAAKRCCRARPSCWWSISSRPMSR
jgi:class 3 adenylate cyclase